MHSSETYLIKLWIELKLMHSIKIVELILIVMIHHLHLLYLSDEHLMVK